MIISSAGSININIGRRKKVIQTFECLFDFNELDELEKEFTDSKDMEKVLNAFGVNQALENKIANGDNKIEIVESDNKNMPSDQVVKEDEIKIGFDANRTFRPGRDLNHYLIPNKDNDIHEEVKSNHAINSEDVYNPNGAETYIIPNRDNDINRMPSNINNSHSNVTPDITFKQTNRELNVELVNQLGRSNIGPERKESLNIYVIDNNKS
jgi:hypothetical protein